jgi:hypothetical protein
MLLTLANMPLLAPNCFTLPRLPLQVNPSRGEKAYSDLEVVKELRAMSNSAKRQGKVAPRVAGENCWPRQGGGGAVRAKGGQGC